jgi:hypothetical protein
MIAVDLSKNRDEFYVFWNNKEKKVKTVISPISMIKFLPDAQNMVCGRS